MEDNGWLPKETAPKDGSWFLALQTNNGELANDMSWGPYEFVSWQTISWARFTSEEIDGITRSFDIVKGTQHYFGGTDTSDEIEFEWWQPLPELPSIYK